MWQGQDFSLNVKCGELISLSMAERPYCKQWLCLTEVSCLTSENNGGKWDGEPYKDGHEDRERRQLAQGSEKEHKVHFPVH